MEGGQWRSREWGTDFRCLRWNMIYFYVSSLRVMVFRLLRQVGELYFQTLLYTFWNGDDGPDIAEQQLDPVFRPSYYTERN